MSKPVPEPVEGWTFRRSQTGRLRATIDGWAAEIIEGELWSQTATPLAVIRALLADTTRSPEWTVGARGELTRHRLERGRFRIDVLSGYDDGTAHGALYLLRSDGDTHEVLSSWFGGGSRTPEESIADAKAGMLRWCRDVGSLADADNPPESRGAL